MLIIYNALNLKIIYNEVLKVLEEPLTLYGLAYAQ